MMLSNKNLRVEFVLLVLAITFLFLAFSGYFNPKTENQLIDEQKNLAFLEKSKHLQQLQAYGAVDPHYVENLFTINNKPKPESEQYQYEIDLPNRKLYVENVENPSYEVESKDKVGTYLKYDYDGKLKSLIFINKKNYPHYEAVYDFQDKSLTAVYVQFNDDCNYAFSSDGLMIKERCNCEH
ncbi:hypothetical protein [Vampirovibrio sp.]|uniref:hypothetical protein n=1 Tax=Vampirovibrio sp. TaxID=2717857 RepID=UPI0035946B9E